MNNTKTIIVFPNSYTCTLKFNVFIILDNEYIYIYIYILLVYIKPHY